MAATPTRRDPDAAHRHRRARRPAQPRPLVARRRVEPAGLPARARHRLDAVPSRLASNIPPLTLPASYDVASARAGAVRTASFDAPPAAGAGALLNRLRVDSTDGPRAGGGALARAAGADRAVLESSEFRSDLAARPRRGTSDEVEVDLADDEDGRPATPRITPTARGVALVASGRRTTVEKRTSPTRLASFAISSGCAPWPIAAAASADGGRRAA